MDRPPLDAGAVHDTSDDPSSPDVAVTSVGRPGSVGALIVAGADDSPVPAALIATTVNV